MAEFDCVLGIDIGTSRVKTVLVDKNKLTILQESSLELGDSENIDVPGGSERDVTQILTVLEACLDKLDSRLLSVVRAIGVCGQMHGCVLWSSKWSSLSSEHKTPSHLVTWQDGRCDADFLSTLPQTNPPISSGYGCATLAWLQRYQPEKLAGYDRAGTIMDLVVWRLCADGEQVLMSTQNAVSWGYFNLARMSWELEVLENTGFPVHLLPRVVSPPARAGSLKTTWHGVPSGVAVGVAMGDLQCSILAADPKPTDAVLNIGSASQLAVIKTSPLPNLPSSAMEVPYFSDQTLIVAASLTGGNVVSMFVRTLASWLTELGQLVPSDEDVYTGLISRAEERMETSLRVDVRLWGERYLPAQTGSVSNVTPDNLSLGDVCSAMCRGVAENLRSMISAEVLQQLKIERVLGSGSSLLKNRVLRKYAERVFEVPLVVKEGVDAPLGAAMAVKTL